jgi:transposase
VRAWSKGRSTVVLRDVDAFGRRVQLRWRKRRWRCREQRCVANTWTETSEAIAPRAVTGWFATRDDSWLAAVQRVALDPYRGSYNALVGGLDAP